MNNAGGFKSKRCRREFMSDESYTVAGRKMPEVSIAAGATLSVWGIIAYFLSTSGSPTALIPMIFGAPIAILGLLSIRMPEKRKIFMHISAMFGLLCALGGGGMLSGIDSDTETLKIASFAILFLVGAIYTYFCVQSFRWARKQREAAEA